MMWSTLRRQLLPLSLSQLLRLRATNFGDITQELASKVDNMFTPSFTNIQEINKKIKNAVGALPADDVTYSNELCQALEKQIAEVEGKQSSVAEVAERIKTEVRHENSCDIANIVTEKWVNEFSNMRSELQVLLSGCQSSLSAWKSVSLSRREDG